MKIKHRYQLIINNSSRLQTIWQVKFTPLRAIFALLITLIAATALAVIIIVFTPLKNLLPGYMKKDQRVDVISTMLLVDSLQMRYDRNQTYLENLRTVLDTDRAAHDSSNTAHPNISDIDTLVVAGEQERAFVRKMEEKEKYNISIAAPLAAKGMIFTMPAAGAIISADTKQSKIATVIIPKDKGIDAISDGTVVDKYYDSQHRTYTIVIQHEKGFMTRYSHLGSPVVDRGMSVTAGQQIARQAQGGIANPELVYVEVWRHGIALIPSDYIRSFNYSQGDNIHANSDLENTLDNNRQKNKPARTR